MLTAGIIWANSGRWWRTGKPGVPQSMGSQRVGHDWAIELNWEHHQSMHKKIKHNNIWHIFKNDCCVRQDSGSTPNPTPVHRPSPSMPQAPPFPPFISQLYALPVLNSVLLFSILYISCHFPWIIKPSSRMEGYIINQFLSVPSTKWHFLACHWPLGWRLKHQRDRICHTATQYKYAFMAYLWGHYQITKNRRKQ